MSNRMIAVKLFKSNDNIAHYNQHPTAAYLPSFLSGEQDKENIRKRIISTFLKSDPQIIKAGWHYQDDANNVFWVDPIS
jgi:hypothetical protein